MATIRSDNYQLVLSHYTQLLSEHYTWTFGNADAKYNTNHALLEKYLPIINTDQISKHNQQALDLGCGSGFQTIPLAKMGWQVTAVDLSQSLLDEIKQEAKRKSLEQNIAQLVQGDLLGFASLVTAKPFDTVVCMGDTLTHLADVQEVSHLFKNVFDALNAQGIFILQFRDLTKPLLDTDRFIQVRSDERTVFSCFLEWESFESPSGSDDRSGCRIRVHDLVHVKKGIGAWELCKSWYRKLGLTGRFVIDLLVKFGFTIVDAMDENGMITIVSRK